MKKKFFIKTFGCQQNVRDSKDLEGAFLKKGFKETKDWQEAEVVVVNSCSVRQSAEDRVYGLVNNVKNLKKKGLLDRPRIILTGCMVGLHGEYELRKKLEGVEVIRREELLKRLGGRAGISLGGEKKADVNIMIGCDNFCTYCVVPFARGREKSKSLEEVIREVECLRKKGTEEIRLLGQNVNSWGKEFKIPDLNSQILKLKLKDKIIKNSKTPFALLLKAVCGIKGVKKVSFLTSNPQDLTDDIIEAMKQKKVERHLHLPVQSGDDEILRKMNRKYTSEEYLNLVKKIKKEIPEIELGTDIIVGFPGETKSQFENTYKLCKKVGFKVAYIAMYSPRPRTAAYKMADDVSHKEKKRRWQLLEELINRKKDKR